MQVGKKNLEKNITLNQTDNGIDPVSILPEELILEIFSYLGAGDLMNCRLMDNRWCRLSTDPSLDFSKLKELVSNGFCIIGRGTWTRYIGEVGDTPPLPKEAISLLKSGLKSKDYILVLIPKEVNDNPLTLNSIEEFVKNPKAGGHATRYRHTWPKILAKHGNKPQDKTYWFLMTKNILPGSRGKTRDEQLALACSIEGHEAPNLLEAVTACFMRYVKTKERMLPNRPWSYTCCSEEKIDNRKLVVGGFLASGLVLNDDCYNYDSRVGVVSLRKF